MERLISDPAVPPERRVMYAIKAIAGLWHGEAAGLRWRHYVMARYLYPYETERDDVDDRFIDRIAEGHTAAASPPQGIDRAPERGSAARS